MKTQEEWMMIHNLKHMGLSNSEIARQLNMDRKTVSKYLKCKETPKYQREKRVSILDEFKEYINRKLERYNISSQKLYEEIKKQGYKGGYSLVNKYVKIKKDELKIKAVLRFESLPGEQSQVDWGYCGKIYDREHRKEIRLYCFVMILGYSRMRYVEFFEDQKLEHFLEGHNNAFQYFGGYTREILYDNLKSVVIKRMFRMVDSQYNKKFLDYAGYYGFKPILARPYKPQTKGKVESSVKYVKNNFLAGEEFESLKEVNRRVKKWLEKINNSVHHTTHEKPQERLPRENLIPVERKELYDLTQTYYRKVHIDCHFSYGGNYYSVPYQYAGREIALKVQKRKVIALYRDKQIAEHEINKAEKYKYITDPKHIEGLREYRMKYKKVRCKPNKEEKPAVSINLMHNNSAVAETTVIEKRDLKIYE